MFGDPPKDSNVCTDSPKMVVRQVGNEILVYDIERAVAYVGEASSRLLKCFDPKVTLVYDGV